MTLTLEKFKQTYFYKTELMQLCRKYGLPTYGTKAELNQYLKSYLSGISVNEIKAKRIHKSHKNNQKITLETKILGEGFGFNQEARKFFAKYFGVENFVFKKEMAIIKRQAERNNDVEMTVRNLLEKYQEVSKHGGMISETAEESTYQWNNFVRDFCKNSESQKYAQKLKVASILWKKVKNSQNTKKFEKKLMHKYKKEISNYLIK